MDKSFSSQPPDHVFILDYMEVVFEQFRNKLGGRPWQHMLLQICRNHWRFVGRHTTLNPRIRSVNKISNPKHALMAGELKCESTESNIPLKSLTNPTHLTANNHELAENKP
jgi:hypothetical protein